MSVIDNLPQEIQNNIIDDYKNNISLRQLEKKYHHSRQLIAKFLEQQNIKTTTGNHYRKYFFDFNFFEKIDSEKKAYWLGFLYADGCITTPSQGEQGFKLVLAKQDEEILEKFNQDLKSTYPIRYDYSKYKLTEGKTQVQAICSLRSQKTVDDLKRLGCVERKSLILTFPTDKQVPEQYIYHFIRGYFDGDGSFSWSNEKGYATVNFVGTEQFIKELSKYFKGGSVFPDKRKSNSWYYTINGKQQIIDAFHKMYDNSNRYLLRKYNKFLSYIN